MATIEGKQMEGKFDKTERQDAGTKGGGGEGGSKPENVSFGGEEGVEGGIPQLPRSPSSIVQCSTS